MTTNCFHYRLHKHARQQIIWCNKWQTHSRFLSRLTCWGPTICIVVGNNNLFVLLVGTWVRSEMMGDVMRNENFRGSDEEFERLLFFNDHLEYAVFNKKCEKHDLPENVSFPMEWDWVKTAEWKSVVDPRTNKTMDSWTGHVRDVVATLYVGQGNPNMPMGLVWRGEHGEEDTRFMSFNTDEPSPAAFEVPEVCKMASTSGPRKPKGL